MIIPEHLLGIWECQVLQACERASERTKSSVYLVGGPVRDLLQGVPSGDLDLAVHGNEDAFAATLAELLSADLSSNGRFLTWKIFADAARHVDLARIRTETYPRPGALPVVAAASSIDEDLRRRDFTVNAIAVRLNDGSLIDPLGGRTDLDARVLRILHDESFRDDPTRIFRALRLTIRCGLTIDPATSKRLDEAIGSGALETVTRERLWKEIDIACIETAPVHVMRTFAERGCLDSLFGPLNRQFPSCLPDNLEIPAGIDPRVVIIGTLVRGKGARSFESLPWDRATIAKIRAIAERDPSLGHSLASLENPDDRYNACESASDEERFLASVEAPEVAGIVSSFVETIRSTRSIRGDGLGVPPGPWIGRALGETRRRVFAGTIGAGEASAFARQLAMKYLND